MMLYTFNALIDEPTNKYYGRYVNADFDNVHGKIVTFTTFNKKKGKYDIVLGHESVDGIIKLKNIVNVGITEVFRKMGRQDIEKINRIFVRQQI